MKHSNVFLNNYNYNSRLRYISVKNTNKGSTIVWAFSCKKCGKDSYYPMGWHQMFPEMCICANCYRKT